jgi:hypothetical protein
LRTYYDADFTITEEKMLEIKKVTDSRGLKEFVNMAWGIYENDNNWVPPLRKQLIKKLSDKGGNPLFEKGPHKLFLVMENKKAVGRVLTGINERLNRKTDKKEGYISLFESIRDKRVSKLLFDKAADWLKSKGMKSIVGPVSPTDGDDSKGILIDGFNGPPVLMNSYNPKYYVQFFEDYEFRKYMDLYAYYLNVEEMDVERFGRVVEYAMNRYEFRIDRFNKKNLEKEASDIKSILDVSMPGTWEHLTPPSMEEIQAQIKLLTSIMDEDLVYIARVGNKPIGLVVALPDYNQVLKKLNGRLFPTGIFKYLWYKRKIDGGRVFMQFVIPEFRNRAVNGAIFHRLMIESKKKGYTHGEGSCIAEMNTESIRSVEGAGGKLYRTYRLFRKDI